MNANSFVPNQMPGGANQFSKEIMSGGHPRREPNSANSTAQGGKRKHGKNSAVAKSLKEGVLHMQHARSSDNSGVPHFGEFKEFNA
jgi:hypothetical protein